MGEDDPVTTLDLGPDAVLGNAAAVDLARAAALEVAPAAQVGEHVGVVADADPDIATHRFACTNTAYAGWHWSVTVVRVPGAETATVSEVVLLPGDGALLAPPGSGTYAVGATPTAAQRRPPRRTPSA